MYQKRVYNSKKVKNMSSKREALYEKLLKRKVLKFDDIYDIAKKILDTNYNRSYINRKYVQQLVKAGRLQRIKRGLYIALSPTEEKPQTDKILIASKIKPEYYLGFHTALEFHGAAYSAYKDAYVCVKPEHRFNPFNFEGNSFRPVFVEDTKTEIEKKDYMSHSIRLSSKERTFIECLDRIEYAGGWEEALKSLENLGGLQFEKIQSLALQNEKQILIRKTGFVLEFLKDRSIFYEHLPQRVLKNIEDNISGQPTYLIRGKKGPLNPRWRLYIPSGFDDKLRGI